MQIVSEIYIDRRFLKDSCYSQQIISAVAKEYLIPYNLIQRAPETQNLQYCNTKYQAKPNEVNVKCSSFFRMAGFVLYTHKQ